MNKKILLLTFGSLMMSSVHAHKPNLVFKKADDPGRSETEMYGTPEFFYTPTKK